MPGLYIYEDFVNEEEEKAILKDLLPRPWSMLNKRRVQHYGFEFNYGTRAANTEPISEFPEVVTPLCDRMKHILSSEFSVCEGEEAQRE